MISLFQLLRKTKRVFWSVPCWWRGCTLILPVLLKISQSCLHSLLHNMSVNCRGWGTSHYQFLSATCPCQFLLKCFLKLSLLLSWTCLPIFARIFWKNLLSVIHFKPHNYSLRVDALGLIWCPALLAIMLFYQIRGCVWKEKHIVQCDLRSVKCIWPLTRLRLMLLHLTITLQIIVAIVYSLWVSFLFPRWRFSQKLRHI